MIDLEETSPFRAYASSFTGRDGLYAAHDVMILWNLNSQGEAVDLTVCLRPLDHGFEDKVSERFDRWQGRYSNANGNCVADWMRGDPRATPAALFGWLLIEEKFPNREQTINAIRQFAKIRECEWARQMVAALPQDEEPMSA